MRAASWTTDADGLFFSSDTLTIRQCSVSSMDNNVYLLTCRHTGEQLLVDAADDLQAIKTLIANSTRDATATSVTSIATTHRHWDHHRALAAAVESTGATTYAGAPDANHLPIDTDVSLEHGDVITVGDLEITVVALRGHTPGSIALAVAGHDNRDDGPGEETTNAAALTVLVTGDSLFPGGPGKTDSPADFTSLMDDLESRVFDVYADSTLVLPGHGDGTTLGAERAHLPDWRQRGW